MRARVVTAWPPPECPLVDCPDLADQCKDEACDEQNSDDFTKFGTVTAVTGICLVTPTSTPAGLKAMNQGASVVMGIAIDSAPAGERVTVMRRGNELDLCEENGADRKCAPGLAVMLPQTIHLWGIVTSDDPPRATFSLGRNDGKAERTIELTHPFAQGDVVAAVGCVLPTDPCTMEIDDALVLLRSE